MKLMRALRLILGVLCATALFQEASFAVEPGERLTDPVLEARARSISEGLRCVVCQNQSIDDSDAPIAHDLRLLVRRQLEKGATDDEVVDYIVARYGEFVLLRPRFNTNTALLWLTPLILLAGGGLLAWRTVARGLGASPSSALSDDEERELRAVLASDSDERDPVQPRGA
jgi:cytochrome c-type biogenesis protein CcmH